MCSTKIFLALIFNEIKCRVNTSLGLVGGCIPPVSAPETVHRFSRWRRPTCKRNQSITKT